MKALLLPADEYGCGYYRMRMPAAHTTFDAEVVEGLRAKTSRLHGTIQSVDPRDADVVIFQRPMVPQALELIRQLQLQGVAVVVELDDDLCALDPHHVAYRMMHPRYSPHHNWHVLKQACAEADMVTVSTQALAHRYAGHGRVAVLPNYVEERLLGYRMVGVKTDFGWTGYVPTHPNDLQVVGDSARQLISRGRTFKVVGESVGVAHALGLGQTKIDATGWLPLDAYYAEAARLRVGLVPLADSAFNRAKSWLKGLEYAALGVPFVASPLPEYQDLNGYGLGLLANKAKRWRHHVDWLLDAENREALGEHQREAVRTYLTIERNAWRWDEAWAKAIRNRTRAAKVAA